MMTTFSPQSPASAYFDWLAHIIYNCEMANEPRVKVAASCYGIAQEHHNAIVRLLALKLYAPSFALVRCVFEACIRGEWIALCATDDNVNTFWNNEEPPRIQILLEEIEKTDASSEGILSDFKTKSWKNMCSYNHTGGLHVQRWCNSNSIAPNYSEEDVKEVLDCTETFGTLAVYGIARLANNEQIAGEILLKFKERFGSEA